MKHRMIWLCAAVVLLLCALIPLRSGAAAPSEAQPTMIDTITARANGATKLTDYQLSQRYNLAETIPVYAIQQANGYYSNYMKLRDIAYYLDFDVVWDANDPNAMRLYSDRHYLDNWTAPGPATQVKQATISSMDIYVDDVKVSGVQPMMIDFNNYFKVRDIAKIMDFWCEFSNDGKKTTINLDNNYHYVEESEIAAGAVKSSQYAKSVSYQPLVWYSGEIGVTEDTPVTYSLRDAWGNYDYTKLYLGYTNEGMNAVAQLMLDRNTISKDSSGIKQLGDGNKLNAYYRYPMIEFTRKTGVDKDKAVLRYGDVTNTDIGQGKVKADTNFGINLAIRQLGEEQFADDPSGRNGVKMGYGIMSVEYDADSDFAKAREVTLGAKTVQRILERMNTLSCDEEKVQFLAACVDAKMIYWTGDGDRYNVDAIKQGYNATHYFAPGTEFALMPYSYSSGKKDYVSFQDVGKVWYDDRIYAGACEEYSYVFENLCNAAGYYFVPARFINANHIWDVVWLPDEGKWMGFDASGHVTAINIVKSSSGNWLHFDKSYDGAFYEDPYNTMPEDIYNILDFFMMMEFIKPQEWLSSIIIENP